VQKPLAINQIADHAEENKSKENEFQSEIFVIQLAKHFAAQW
jgi:hypothetical protein